MTLQDYVATRSAEKAAKRARVIQKAPARQRKRGLVISPPIVVFQDGFQIDSAELDPQELRFSLLFWDKLDYPSNNLIEVEPGRDADFLIKAGVLKRTRVAMEGSFSGGDIVRLPLIRAFNILDEAEPATWSVATGDRSISFLDSELQTGRGALVSLHRAIPVPDKDVPLEDVLKFKEKRHSELLALRHYLEAIYIRVANSEDGKFALVSETEALEKAAMDHVKSVKGMGLKWRLADLTASVSLVKPAAVALGASYGLGLPALESLLAGAAAAGLDIKAGGGLSRARSAETPFRYVSSYHKEVFPLS